jgi:hypothetical protein
LGIGASPGVRKCQSVLIAVRATSSLALIPKNRSVIIAGRGSLAPTSPRICSGAATAVAGENGYTRARRAFQAIRLARIVMDRCGVPKRLFIEWNNIIRDVDAVKLFSKGHNFIDI